MMKKIHHTEHKIQNTKNQTPNTTYAIGLISDTHGLLRPEAVSALGGVDLIVHAGDIGKKPVLDSLKRIAPVIAVRGNMDYGLWSHQLPETDIVEKNGLCLYVLHDLNRLDLDPEAAKIDVIVSGHTHKPHLYAEKGVLFMNPGSAGQRRFDYPVTIGRIRVGKNKMEPEIIQLEID